MSSASQNPQKQTPTLNSLLRMPSQAVFGGPPNPAYVHPGAIPQEMDLKPQQVPVMYAPRPTSTIFPADNGIAQHQQQPHFPGFLQTPRPYVPSSMVSREQWNPQSSPYLANGFQPPFQRQTSIAQQSAYSAITTDNHIKPITSSAAGSPIPDQKDVATSNSNECGQLSNGSTKKRNGRSKVDKSSGKHPALMALQQQENSVASPGRSVTPGSTIPGSPVSAMPCSPVSPAPVTVYPTQSGPPIDARRFSEQPQPNHSGQTPIGQLPQTSQSYGTAGFPPQPPNEAQYQQQSQQPPGYPPYGYGFAGVPPGHPGYGQRVPFAGQPHYPMNYGVQQIQQQQQPPGAMPYHPPPAGLQPGQKFDQRRHPSGQMVNGPSSGIPPQQSGSGANTPQGPGTPAPQRSKTNGPKDSSLPATPNAQSRGGSPEEGDINSPSWPHTPLAPSSVGHRTPVPPPSASTPVGTPQAPMRSQTPSGQQRPPSLQKDCSVLDRLVQSVQYTLTPELAAQRRHFFNMLLNFSESKGQPITAQPTVSKQVVDLHRLYMAVRERGGFEQVTKTKSWKNLCVEANRDLPESSAAGYQLRRHYIKCLLDFECAETGRDPQELIDLAEKQKKPKRRRVQGQQREQEELRFAEAANQQQQQRQQTPPYGPADGNWPTNAPPFGAQMPGHPQSAVMHRPPWMAGPPNNVYPGQAPPHPYGHSPMQPQARVPPPSGATTVPTSTCPTTAQSPAPPRQPSVPQQPSTGDIVVARDPFDDRGIPPPVSQQIPVPQLAVSSSTEQEQSIPPPIWTSASSTTTNSTHSVSGPSAQPSSTANNQTQVSVPQPTVAPTVAPETVVAPVTSEFLHVKQEIKLEPQTSVQETTNSSTTEQYRTTQTPNASVPAPMPPVVQPQISIPQQQMVQQPMVVQPTSVAQMSQAPPTSLPYGGAYNSQSQMMPPASHHMHQVYRQPIHYQYQQPGPSYTPQVHPQNAYTSESYPTQYHPSMPPSVPVPQNQWGAQTQWQNRYHPNQHPQLPSNTYPPQRPAMLARESGPKMPQQQWYGANQPNASFAVQNRDPRAMQQLAVQRREQQQQPQPQFAFPMGTVEATQHSQRKRRKIINRDIGKVDSWRLVMSLKSGLELESLWALNILNILLYDDSTVLYFGLRNLPGLLEVLVENFRRCLIELFPDNGFDALESNVYECKNSDNLEESTQDEDKLPVIPTKIVTEITSDTNYSRKTRTGRLVKIVDAGKGPSNRKRKLMEEVDFETVDFDWQKGTGMATEHLKSKRWTIEHEYKFGGNILKCPPKEIKEEIDENSNKEIKTEIESDEKFPTKSIPPFYFRETISDEKLVMLSEEILAPINKALTSNSSCKESLVSRCLAFSNALRGLSFVPGNDAEMAKHCGLLAIIGRLLLLLHDHLPVDSSPKKPFPLPVMTIKEEQRKLNSKTESLDVEPVLLECVRTLREDAFVLISQLSAQLDLYNQEELVSRPILEALIHWSICGSAEAKDPLTPGPVSPLAFSLETLCKLSVLERNVDMILATGPWPKMERFLEVLGGLLGLGEDIPIREFAVVLVHAFCNACQASCAVCALRTPAVHHLVAFLELADSSMHQVVNQHGMQALRDNPELMGTSVGMLRRAASILQSLSKVAACQPRFVKHQQRLLQFTMSQLMDSRVAAIIADTLFELQKMPTLKIPPIIRPNELSDEKDIKEEIEEENEVKNEPEEENIEKSIAEVKVERTETESNDSQTSICNGS